MDFDAPVSMWMASPPILRLAVTLTYDLQNLTRLPVWAGAHSL